jgi:RNA polymerase sigma-70 factor (ECF subfamily)
MELQNGATRGPLTDEQLVERYRAGDRGAFEQLVRRYRTELYHFLVRFLNSRHAAEDVFQEAFLQVHLSIESFDTSRRFRPWLFTIAANKARDYLRRNAQRTMLPLSAPVDGAEGRPVVDLMEGDSSPPAEDVESEEIRQQVRQVVATLPEHLREILLLAYFHRVPYKQIAEMLDIPLGTVKSRLHAAVGTFADFWRQRHGTEPPMQEPSGKPAGS